MKKLLGLLAIAGFMAACNNGENTDAAADSARKDLWQRTRCGVQNIAARKRCKRCIRRKSNRDLQ
jgi:hypothetical protein